MMFIEYIPTFAFSKTYFLVFSGRTFFALQCKSENDQLMDANKKRFSLVSPLASWVSLFLT